MCTMAEFDESLLEDEQVGTFSSVEDELMFWKTRAERLKTALVDTRTALEEFQQDSRDYEDELERNVELLDAQCKELRNVVNVLQIEVDHWKEKFQESKVDTNHATDAMQREIDFLKNSHQKFKERTRTLEQDNDDLERYGRVASTSLKDIELKLNQTLERNAFLESEMEVKSKLVVVVQRLKDELRDLQLEVSVLRSKRSSTQMKRRSLSSKPEETATNPVKMVQEMLGRVKSLENRLVNCRSLVTPLLTPPPSYSSTATSTPMLSSTSSSTVSSVASSGIKRPSLMLPTGRRTSTRTGNRSVPSSPISSSPTPSSTGIPMYSTASSSSKIPAGPRLGGTGGGMRSRSMRLETPTRIRRISDLPARTARA